MITSAICNSFKQGLLEGKFDFSSTTSQTFKIALYTSSANLGAQTSSYSTTNEVVGSGYTAGGLTLTISVYPTVTNGVAYMNFSNATWPVTSITARGALIYKSDGATNPAIATLDFGQDTTTSGGSFEVEFPLSTAQTAIIRSV